jgi:hypothetical protein
MQKCATYKKAIKCVALVVLLVEKYKLANPMLINAKYA